MAPPAPLVVASAWLAGSVPVAQLVARTRGADLRRVGTGTVSGSGLFAVAGGRALALAGSVELAKGALGPLLAGRHRPVLGGLAAAAAVVGHDWSPFLGLAGGRGVSVVLGASAVLAPAGAAGLLASLAVGRALGETGLATLLGLALVPVAARRPGGPGMAVGAGLVLPVVVKRLVGNDARPPTSFLLAASRLLADRDDWPALGLARPVAATRNRVARDRMAR